MHSEKDRISLIDSLKGWAILGTIMVHSGLWGQGRAEIFACFGARMCQLFFIISAYLMYRSYKHLTYNQEKKLV